MTDSYKTRYALYLAQNNRCAAAFTLIGTDIPPEIATCFIKDARRVIQKGRSDKLINACIRLIHAATPDAIDLLIDPYIERLFLNKTVLSCLHLVNDERFRDVWFERMTYHLSPENFDVFGNLREVTAALQATARMNDDRAINLFVTLIEQNDNVAFITLTPGRNDTAIAALQALDLMQHPRARAIADDLLQKWREQLTMILRERSVFDVPSVTAIPDFLLHQPLIIDHVIRDLPHYRPLLDQKQPRQILNWMLVVNERARNPQYFVEQLLNLARTINDRALLRDILLALPPAHYPAATDLALSLAVHHPVDETTYACLSILNNQQVLSLSLADEIIYSLRRISEYSNIMSKRDRILECLDYLSLFNMTAVRLFLLAFMEVNRSVINLKTSYKIVGRMAQHDDYVLNILICEIDTDLHHVNWDIVHALIGNGERGLPFLIGLLQKETPYRNTVLRCINSEQHAPLIPYLLDIYINTTQHRASVTTALERIGTEDAYEALLIIRDMESQP